MVPPIGNERIVSMLACPHELHAGGGIKTIVAKRISIEPFHWKRERGGGEELLPQILPEIFHNCHQIIPPHTAVCTLA